MRFIIKLTFLIIIVWSFFLFLQKTYAQSLLNQDFDIFWISPIWHRLESSFMTGPLNCPLTGNCWADMVARLGGNNGRYLKISMTAAAWYLGHTTGQANDWHFKSDFYDPNASPEHQNDNLQKYYDMAKQYNLYVVLNLVGEPWGEWIDCPVKVNGACSSPDDNVAAHLELDRNNVQWDQYDRDPQERAGFGPPLQRNLSYHPYNPLVRNYLKRNLQEAIAWVWSDPDRSARTIAYTIDADSFLTVWDSAGKYFDYNPGSLKQFQEWQTCTGLYSQGQSYYNFRHHPCLASPINPPRPTGTPTSNTDWQEWTKFRQHQVFLQLWEKMKWVNEVGIPENMIYGHNGVGVYDPLYISEFLSGRDQSGATIEGSGIPPFGTGIAPYGPDAKNANNQFFQNIKTLNSNWGIPETSPVSLSETLPTTYDDAYTAIHQAFLHQARFISPIAWHVGYADGGADQLGPVKVRDTAYEDAIRDFIELYGSYRRGTMVWEFGKKSSKCADKTGITKKPGTNVACSLNDRIDHTQLEGWTPNTQLINQALGNGIASFTVDGGNPFFTSPGNLAFPASSKDQVRLRLKFSSANNVSGQIYWLTEADQTWNEVKHVDFPIIADDQWHDYIIPVGNQASWAGVINRIRIDPGTSLALKGKQIGFDWIQLTKGGFPGDLNGDDQVDIFDYNILVSDFGQTGSPGFVPADIDNNGKVDIFDYNLVVENFGKTQ